MNEEIEYAQMLEIPVSTVNVVKKRGRKPKKSTALKEKVISKVNEGIETPAPVMAEEPAPLGAEEIAVAETQEAALPIRLPAEQEEVKDVMGKYKPFSYESMEDDFVPARRERLILGIEFAAACALCFGIFLTNVFLPNSAINTFFRSLVSEKGEQADARVYSDFTLSPIVLEDGAELTVSETGIVSFTKSCCVYPAANGKVEGVAQNADGSFTVKIAHSPTFSEVVSGLDYIPYAVGDSVKANVPLGYSDGEGEVQVTMYDSGELLNCFSLSEEGALVWNVVEE